jgi:quercetin dioxygenase-like cupin family protein
MDILHLTQDQGGESAQLGPYLIESLIPREQEAALTAYRVSIGPGNVTAVSYHLKAEELYYVLGGSGVALLNGEEHPLRAGDFLRLPPGTRHGFVTDKEELSMLNIHSPGSRPDRDVYFEGAVPPGFTVPCRTS